MISENSLLLVRIPTLGHFIDQILSLFLSCSLRGVAEGVRREDIHIQGQRDRVTGPFSVAGDVNSPILILSALPV